MLYLSNGTDSVYLKVQETLGRPQNLSIQSTTYLTKAHISGYIRPTLRYTWAAAVIDAMDRQITPIKEVISLALYEAYITRKVVSKDFHCHLLLLQNNKMDVIAKVNNEILPASQKQKITSVQQEYTMVDLPRTSLYPTAQLLSM